MQSQSAAIFWWNPVPDHDTSFSLGERRRGSGPTIRIEAQCALRHLGAMEPEESTTQRASFDLF